jgi:hypothetical protein
MWANHYASYTAVHETRPKALAERSRIYGVVTGPVAVIPLDDPEALVDAAVTGHYHLYGGIATRIQAMRAALTAIGVLPKQKKGRK